jgi:hypothetical protein
VPLTLQAWLSGPLASTVLVPGAALACLAAVGFPADPRSLWPPTSTSRRGGQDRTRLRRQQRKIHDWGGPGAAIDTPAADAPRALGPWGSRPRRSYSAAGHA